MWHFVSVCYVNPLIRYTSNIFDFNVNLVLTENHSWIILEENILLFQWCLLQKVKLHHLSMNGCPEGEIIMARTECFIFQWCLLQKVKLYFLSMNECPKGEIIMARSEYFTFFCDVYCRKWNYIICQWMESSLVKTITEQNMFFIFLG